MSAPKCLTLGDLRAATTDMPDDVRLVYARVLLGETEENNAYTEGRHEQDRTDACEDAVHALCLTRFGDEFADDDPQVVALDDLRTGGPDDDLRAQVAALTAERDRLARVLACEVGDAEHASDGWQRDVHHRWSRRSPDFYLVAFKWGGTHTWEAWDNPDGTLICHGRAKYALDAMEAADEAARAGEAS